MEVVAFPYHHRTPPPNLPPHKTGKPVVNWNGLTLRFSNVKMRKLTYDGTILAEKSRARTLTTAEAVSGSGDSLPPLDLTEDNIRLVLSDARVEVKLFFSLSDARVEVKIGTGEIYNRFTIPEFDLTESHRLFWVDLLSPWLCSFRIVELAQLFDLSVGITGQVELVELDGPFVKISLRGKFWHTRSMVLARIGNYLKQRIPEILEVEIEDEKQLDDSPANF